MSHVSRTASPQSQSAQRGAWTVAANCGPGRHPLWFYLAALVAYAAIAVGATWPLLARLTTHLPDGTDTLLHYWNGWWAWEALSRGQSPFFTSLLFYPNGLSLVYHNYPWLHILPWGVLRLLVGGVAAYNLVFLIHLALCGFAAFLLVDELVGAGRAPDRRLSRWSPTLSAAFVAGLIYQLWPYRMSQPSHPNMMSTEWEPLAVLFLVRLVRHGRWRDGLLAGLFLALVGYNRWQLLIPVAIVVGLYVVLNLPASMGRRQVYGLLIAAAVTAVALVPPALLFLAEWRANPADLIIEEEETTMQTDLLAYVTPPRAHPLLGRFTEAAYKRYYPQRGSRHKFSPYLGATVLFLVVLGVATTRLRDSLPWIGIAVVLFLLALGPVLQVGGRAYPAVPMPYGLASRLFVVRLLRAPERFNMSLALPITVLAAYGAAYLISRFGRRRPWNIVLPLGLAAGVVLEYLAVPMLLQPARVSDFYGRLASEPGDFAVLNVPVDPYQSKPYMFAQVVHRRPILQGHSSRYPKGAFAYLDGQPWLRAMRRYSDLPPRQRDVSRQLSRLAEDGIRYLIVHKRAMGDDRWPKWARYLAVKPRFEDGDIAVYATTPVTGQDYELGFEMAPGVGMIRSISSGPCLDPGRAFELDVAWGTTVAPGKDLDVELALVTSDGKVVASSVYPLSEGWPSGEWPPGAIAWGHYVLSVPAAVEGDVKAVLRLLDAQTGVSVGSPVAVEQAYISSSPCSFVVPPDVAAVNATFGEPMRLVGYRVEQGGNDLALTLYWRADHRMDVDYKVFVHVYDSATGFPVAQDDAMPQQWTYPTTFWDPGEVVVDEIRISLAEVPAGSYGLAMGVYDPASGVRLPVVDGTGQVQPDDRLVLQGEVVKVR